MKIKLKGELDHELTRIGLSAGDIIENVEPQIGPTTGQVYFKRRYNNWTYHCVVWAENYEIIEN